MTANEAQANPDTVTRIMFVFGRPTRVLFYFGFSRSFVSSSFALHVDWELSLLKNKLVITKWCVQIANAQFYQVI